MSVHDDKKLENSNNANNNRTAVKGGISPCEYPGVICCGDIDKKYDKDKISPIPTFGHIRKGETPSGYYSAAGCGSPVTAADLRPGETVLDLGSGTGCDCFQAAELVGPSGHVIGVEIAPDMLKLARRRISASPVNVEFRFGELARLPITGGSIDAVLSNYAINLAPDKRRVFSEVFRVLKPGGRLNMFDIVAVSPLPEEILTDLEAYVGCIAGAIMIDELMDILRDVGFREIAVHPQCDCREFINGWMPDRDVDKFVVPAAVTAVKSP